MSSSELFIILAVALLAFGPKKLPMLARHIGQFIAWINRLQQQLGKAWQEELNKQQLEDNLKKAAIADKAYEADEGKKDLNPKN
ncbi:Sec-independent protein translocase subunit TatA/TatB [Legionella londiniensis]|nr:twin-arginine translocase TatA/TatE family subunit [Legionella londiniensis]